MKRTYLLLSVLIALLFACAPVVHSQHTRVSSLLIVDRDPNMMSQTDVTFTGNANALLVYGFGASTVSARNGDGRINLHGLNAYGEYSKGVVTSELFTRVLISDAFILLYDASVSGQPTRWLRLNSYASRDLSGIVQDTDPIFVSSYGGGMDMNVWRTTLVADARQVQFSDGNDRSVYTGKVNVDLTRNLAVVIESRYTESSRTDVAYFSPSTHWRNTGSIGLGIVMPRGHTVLRPNVTYGWETIGDEAQRKQIAGVGISGRTNHPHGKLNYWASYSRSANPFGEYDLLVIGLRGVFRQN
jgi:hypothetical protein